MKKRRKEKKRKKERKKEPANQPTNQPTTTKVESKQHEGETNKPNRTLAIYLRAQSVHIASLAAT